MTKFLLIARLSPRINTRSHLIAATMAKRRWQVTTLTETCDYSVEAPPSLENIRLIELRLALHGKHVWYFTGIFRMLQFNIRALLEAIAGGYDVICCGDVPYAVPGVISKALLGKKFVLDSHEIIWDCGLSRRLSLLLKWLEKAILKYCDLWLVASEDRARVTLKAQGLDRSYTVLENFPIPKDAVVCTATSPDKRSSIKTPPNMPVVMFQGTLMPDRGIEELVEAARGGNFHAVIQGVVIEGSNGIKQFLDKYTHAGVTVLPPSPTREVVDWLGLADLAFVYYKNDCLNSAYACSNKFYTAIFAGIPIVCNRLPAFESFAQKYGGVVFFDELSPQEINRRVSAVLVDPHQYTVLKDQVLAARQQLLGVSSGEIIASAFERLMKQGKNV